LLTVVSLAVPPASTDSVSPALSVMPLLVWPELTTVLAHPSPPIKFFFPSRGYRYAGFGAGERGYQCR
jgi:hypothetical protein